MIFTFSQFLKEELKVSQINSATLSVLKQNIKDRLIEYKKYLLNNIIIRNNKAIYRNFEKIEKRIIIRELENEFTKEFIEELKLNDFLDKLDVVYANKNRNVKNEIRKLFENYFKFLEKI
jgi:hypothetical protein